MMMNRTMKRVLTLGWTATAAVALVACGDDGGSTTATAAPTQTQGATATVAPAGADAPAGDALNLVPASPEALGAPEIPEAIVSTSEGAEPFAAAVAKYQGLGTDAALGEFPRVVRHGKGETTIESQPTRVVVLDTGEIDAVVAMGLIPVGMPEESAPVYLEEQLADVATVGPWGEPDLEAIAALRPDLILTNSTRHDDLYESLSAIAPTVYGPQVGLVWRYNLALYAQALGREQEAATLVADYEERVRALNQALPSPRPTVSVIRVLADNVRYYQRSNFIGLLLTDLGFPRPEAQNVDDFALLNQSIETLRDSGDADVIFVSMVGGAENAYGQELLESPLFQSLGGVQSERYMVVDDSIWIAGLGYAASHAVLDDIEAMFGLD